MKTAVYDSPLGPLTLAAEAGALVGLWLEGQRHFPGALPAPEAPEGVLLDAFRWLDAYFRGERPDPEALPLAPEGTPFRKAVWVLLTAIPYGETVTYGELSRMLQARGQKASPRSVGGAVGRNPISIVIPCHRVIGAGEKLTGYAGGLDRKQWLLHHEKTPPFK